MTEPRPNAEVDLERLRAIPWAPGVVSLPSAGDSTGLHPAERRGRRWIFGSFVFCPCHLPLTLAVLATVLGGTGLGALLRDHAVVAGAIITAAWVAGTWRGFRLVRLAQQQSCPTAAPAHR